MTTLPTTKKPASKSLVGRRDPVVEIEYKDASHYRQALYESENNRGYVLRTGYTEHDTRLARSTHKTASRARTILEYLDHDCNEGRATLIRIDDAAVARLRAES